MSQRMTKHQMDYLLTRLNTVFDEELEIRSAPYNKILSEGYPEYTWQEKVNFIRTKKAVLSDSLKDSLDFQYTNILNAFVYPQNAKQKRVKQEIAQAKASLKQVEKEIETRKQAKIDAVILGDAGTALATLKVEEARIERLRKPALNITR